MENWLAPPVYSNLASYFCICIWSHLLGNCREVRHPQKAGNKSGQEAADVSVSDNETVAESVSESESCTSGTFMAFETAFACKWRSSVNPKERPTAISFYFS